MVQNPPDYVFLCGGKLDDPVHSLRAQFYIRKVVPDVDLLRKIQLAELADQWYQTRKLFDDLLELEEHLAGLSACILLFVESPGAIAEFGAFSQMDSLRNKLIVVVEQSHYKQQSFIRNGPIEQVHRTRPDCLLTYPWLAAPTGTSQGEIDVAALDGTLDEISKALQATLSTKPRTSSFLPKDHGHRMLLIADLVKLNVVSLQSEIQDILRGLGIPLERQPLAKYLYLLEQLGLISLEPYGHTDYYVSAKGTPDFIWYAPKTPADRTRLRSLLREDFPLNTQKTRAVEAFNRRMARPTP